MSREDRDYGVSVLTELLENTKNCSAVLFCGDTFDSFQDMTELRETFCATVQSMCGERMNDGSLKIILLPGNHEELRAPAGASMAVAGNWGSIMLADQLPFSIIPHEDGEIIAIPHQADYGDYASWEIPPRRGTWRIAMAHAAVSGMHFLGPEEEENGSILDPELFSHCQADYAALGHIHKAAEQRYRNILMCFPGSARVWRKHEEGTRGCLRLDITKGSIRHDRIVLQAAGQFRTVNVHVGTDGQCSLPPGFEISGLHPADWIQLDLYGVVENLDAVSEYLEDLQKQINVRKISVAKKHVLELKGIRTNSFVERFENNWSEKLLSAKADFESGISGAQKQIEVLQEARIIALREIYQILQGQT